MHDPTDKPVPTTDTEAPPDPAAIASKIDRLAPDDHHYIEGVIDGMLKNTESEAGPPPGLCRELAGLTEEWEHVAPVLEVLVERTDQALRLSNLYRGDVRSCLAPELAGEVGSRQRISAEDERLGRWLDDSGEARLCEAVWQVDEHLRRCKAQ